MFNEGKNTTYMSPCGLVSVEPLKTSGGSFLLVEQLEGYVNGSQPRDQVPLRGTRRFSTTVRALWESAHLVYVWPWRVPITLSLQKYGVLV